MTGKTYSFDARVGEDTGCCCFYPPSEQVSRGKISPCHFACAPHTIYELHLRQRATLVPLRETTPSLRYPSPRWYRPGAPGARTRRVSAPAEKPGCV
jgi:hypothetical protein